MQTTKSALAPEQVAVPLTSIHKVEADGVQVFYRAAGDPNAPVSSCCMGSRHRRLCSASSFPALPIDYRVIAPDLPGFGFTEVPAERKYTYSFDALAVTLEAFTEALGLSRYALYVFDYGAPTGFRLAMAHPERVTAIVSQNGNAYEEGLGDAWGPIRKYWADADSRKPRGDSAKRFDPGRNSMAVHARRGDSGECCAGVVHIG